APSACSRCAAADAGPGRCARCAPTPDTHWSDPAPEPPPRGPARRRSASDPSADCGHATPTPAPPAPAPSDADTRADATTGPPDSVPRPPAHTGAVTHARSAATPRSAGQQRQVAGAAPVDFRPASVSTFA